MPEKNDEFYEKFTKDIFENIKGLTNDERGEFVISTYENLFGKLKSAASPGTVNVDMRKLRSELGQIRGIGGQRLDEIMAVIERNLFGGKNPADSGKPGSADADNDNGDEEQ
ncbi:MAG: hypothetical protein IJT87_04205 [Ruminiclostridium sp.]|nr:hypothetical protein [Ruminiclostridium sp.]